MATGLADLMKAARLTHGGFYKHFASKDQLIAEATIAPWTASSRSLPLTRPSTPPHLSTCHRDNPASGCPFAALEGETRPVRILGETKVATEDLDAKLREIAARHLTLLKQGEASPDDDPQIAAIKKEALTAIGAGNYRRAEQLLQRAFDADLAAARRAQDAANKRFLAAAKTKADLAELKLTELQFTAAVADFREAVDLVPATEPLVRARYLNRLGKHSAASR